MSFFYLIFPSCITSLTPNPLYSVFCRIKVVHMHSVKTQVGVETLKIKDTVRHHLPVTYSKASLNKTQTIIVPKARETLIFKAPRHNKGPRCTRLSLHVTIHSESISSNIVYLVVATDFFAILQMIYARPWFDICFVIRTQLSLKS